VDPKHAKVWGIRGAAYMKLGQANKAGADFSKAVEQDPRVRTARPMRHAFR
jgi:Tfp pilus assembly protein PilF